MFFAGPHVSLLSHIGRVSRSCGYQILTHKFPIDDRNHGREEEHGLGRLCRSIAPQTPPWSVKNTPQVDCRLSGSVFATSSPPSVHKLHSIVYHVVSKRHESSLGSLGMVGVHRGAIRREIVDDGRFHVLRWQGPFWTLSGSYRTINTYSVGR